MYTDSKNRRALQGWLTVAMFAPLAHYSGGSWPVLAVLALLCVGLEGLMPKNPGCLQQSKLLCAVELVWLLYLAGHYLSLSSEYWPGEKSKLVIPGVLLLLGAYSCKGRPARTAGVLFWILLLMLAPFGFAALKDAKLKWFFPSELYCSGWVIPILLLPAASGWLTDGEKRDTPVWLPYVIGTATWMATSAVLSPKIAASFNAPFRELSRGLVLGAGSRFESLAGVMVTLGWYSLASLFMKLAVQLLGNLGVGIKYAPWFASAASSLLSWLNMQLNPVFSAIFTLFLWVLVPMLHCKKISKKSEKSA